MLTCIMEPTTEADGIDRSYWSGACDRLPLHGNGRKSSGMSFSSTVAVQLRVLALSSTRSPSRCVVQVRKTGER